MMYENLVKRLRDKASALDYDGWVDTAASLEDAADAIEELSRIVREYQKFDGFLRRTECLSETQWYRSRNHRRKMGKAKRKPRPSMPYWFWLGQDGCWFCKNRNNCNQCKANREYAKRQLPKKHKGYHGEPPKEEV